MMASSSRLSSPNTLPAIVLYSQTVGLPDDVAAATETMMTAPKNAPIIKLVPSRRPPVAIAGHAKHRAVIRTIG